MGICIGLIGVSSLGDLSKLPCIGTGTHPLYPIRLGKETSTDGEDTQPITNLVSRPCVFLKGSKLVNGNFNRE